MMKVQLVPNEDAEQVIKLKNYCFKPAYEGKRLEDFRYWIEASTTVGAYDQEKLIGQLLVLPLSLNVFGQPYDMGGIGFVSTYPEYRNAGVMKQILLQSLKEMRENNQLVSVLSPFSVSFYRLFGWELFFDSIRYTIPIDQLAPKGNSSKQIIRFDYTDPVYDTWMDKVKAYHTQEVTKRNGQMFRQEAWWERLRKREPDASFALCLDESGEIRGYIRYTIRDLVFDIRDFFATDTAAEQQLWHYVKAHAAETKAVTGEEAAWRSFGFQFIQPQFKKELIQDRMIRIIDVAAFLRQYPFQKLEQPLYLKVIDAQAEWNHQLFQIDSDKKVQGIAEAPTEEILEMGIGPLSALLMGYHDLSWYRANGDAKVSTGTAALWQQALPSGFPSFYDYF